MAALTELADELRHSRAAAAPIGSFAQRLADARVGDAYRVQQLLSRGGAKPAGYKIGATGAAARARLGLNEPVYGRVFDVYPSGGRLARAGYIAPKLEPECAFRIARAIRGDNVDASDARAAIDTVSPALEIADSRFAGWASTAFDLIADNAAGAGAVLSGEAVPLAGLDFREVRCEATCNGAVIAGQRPWEQDDPLVLIAWLVRALSNEGLGLSPGQFVLTGSWKPPIDVGEGARVHARFSGIGAVEIALD